MADYDFEAYLVVALIGDERFRNYVIDKLPAEAFEQWGCRYLFKIIKRYCSEKKNVNGISIMDYLSTDTSLNDVRRSDLVDFVWKWTVAENAPDLQSIVDGLLPRVQHEVEMALANKFLAESVDLLEDRKPHLVWPLAERVRASLQFTRPVLYDVFGDDDSEAIIQNIHAKGVPCGIRGLNEKAGKEQWLDDQLLYGGLPPASLTLIVGYGGEGKSTFLSNIVLYSSLSGFNVDLYALEKPRDFVRLRMMSTKLGIPSDNIVSGSAKEAVAKKVRDLNLLYPNKGRLRLFFNQTLRLTVDDIARNCASSERDGKKVHLVAVDYLELLKTSKKLASTYEEEDYTTLMLKAAAQEYGFAAVTPSRKNREAHKSRKAERGSIGGSYGKTFTADVVLFLHSEEETRTDVHGKQGIAKRVGIYVDKNTFGMEKHTLVCYPDSTCGRFYNVWPGRS
jgi:replicative DNA helicase